MRGRLRGRGAQRGMPDELPHHDRLGHCQNGRTKHPGCKQIQRLCLCQQP